MIYVLVFFFKQKTAYERRISDWSSDVCSSDLALGKEAGGGPHILVNNAGITRDNLAMRMKDDEWSAVIDTNLAAVFRLSRAVLRGMMKEIGRASCRDRVGQYV